MGGCEYCIHPEDLPDIANRNFFLAVLGLPTDSGLVPERIVSIPESKLNRYHNREYEHRVIRAMKIPESHTRQHQEDELAEMYSDYDINIHSRRYHVDTLNTSHEERLKIAGELTLKLMKKTYVDSVYLTCSTARGDDDSKSDLDLLVVVDSCPGDDGHHKMEKLAESYDCPVDLFVMKRWDFERNMDSECPFIRDRKLLVSR